jgi:hypothetical protein
MEAVERAQPQIADHEIEAHRAQPPAGGFKLEMMIDLRHGPDGIQDDIRHPRIRLDQKDDGFAHRKQAAARVNRTAQPALSEV